MTAQRPLARGILVALEGIDGTGKSTQARHLAAIFREQGYEIALLREPTASPWGRRIREAMAAGHRVLAPSQELDLFLQDRRYNVAAHIRPALAARQLVLSLGQIGRAVDAARARLGLQQLHQAVADVNIAMPGMR